MPRSFSATRRRGRCRAGKTSRANGFRAAKFGWGPFGRSTVKADEDHLDAAREGLGPDGILLVDAGQIFGEDVEAAAARLPALERNRATWFEEPFAAGALKAYAELGSRTTSVAVAGGEAAHNFHMAQHLIDYGRVRYIQIDCGRIGGIGPAKRTADYAAANRRDLRQPYLHVTSGAERLAAAVGGSPRSHDLRVSGRAEAARHRPDFQSDQAGTAAGEILLSDAPGLGIEVSEAALEQYKVDVEILVDGKTLFKSK